MKKFKEFLSEEMLPYAQTEKGFVGVDNGPVRDNINIHLTAITAKPYATPYHAMEMVRKVLAPFSIFPPSVNFLDGESGHEIFEISQFGDKMGMTNNGEVVHKMASPYYVYFEYAMNDTGAFDIFCEIVTEEELEEIVSDIEDEMEDGDTTTGDMPDAEDSYDAYKAKNQVNEASSIKLGKYLDKVNKLNRKELKARGNKPSLASGKILNVGVKVPATNEEKKDDLPFDNPTEKPSTPYKNPKSKAKQLARMAMKKAKEKKLDEEQLDEISKKKLGQYIKAASHDVATKSAATGRYADRANRARDEMKKGDYKNWPQGKKDDEFADKMFKKSWNRRKGIAKAVDKLTK